VIFLIAVMLFVCFVFPLGYAWRVWRLHEPTLGTWALVVADASVIVALVLLVGRWDMAGYYTRYLLLAVFVAAVLWSFGKHKSRNLRADDAPLIRTRWTTLVSLILFGSALAYVLSGMLPPAQPRALGFPLKGGRFVVAQGGGNGLLNHHANHPLQRYAADITAVGSTGFRAAALLPERLDGYAIYGASVISPCNGPVVAARDDLPDLVPPRSDSENSAGNHVIIDCGGFNVELAHLQQGSVAVEVGAVLSVGSLIGTVGNSGNTTEPHLHIHAVDPQSGAGLPVAFDGRVPLRNRRFVNW
jgi:hypothetical protein